MKFKNKILFLFIILILINTVGCQLETEKEAKEIEVSNVEEEKETEIKPVAGGEVSIPLTNFSTLNPLLTDNSSYYHFSKLIFQGIFEFDENLEPTLKLGEFYEILEDGKKIQIKLRDDIFWHDGEPLTASDVKFTIDCIKRAGIAETYGKIFNESASISGDINLNYFISGNIIDAKTIEILFDREFTNMLEVLTFPIIPEHKFLNIDDALRVDNYAPIGTGPFKFIEYERFKSINLKRNKEYWDGLVYIEDIVGKVLDDNDLILTSFESGQMDFAFNDDVDWDKYKQNKRINVYEYISSEYEFLGFNFANKNFTPEESIAIKRAINYGINRQNIIENQYLGHGTQIDVPFHPDLFLISENANKYGYNLNFAKEELNSVGYEDRNGDGIVEDEEGNPLTFNLLTNRDNLSRIRTAELIIEDLREIGIDINLFQDLNMESFRIEDKELKWTGFQDILNLGNYEIFLLGWKTSVVPNISYMFHSTRVLDTNFIKYEDEAMDRILGESLNSSVKNKQESYNKLQDNILDNLPYISLFYKNKALLADSKIKGELEPKFFNLYNGLEKCFILNE